MSAPKNPATTGSTRFVVEDYSQVTPETPDPVTMVVEAKDIFELVDDAKKNSKKIIVYTVGQCVLNWT